MTRRILAIIVLVAVVSLVSPAAPAQEEIWDPPAGVSFQLQLQGTIDTSVEAEVFDIDMFDSPTSLIQELHDKGAKVVCYISAGSYENWRPDKKSFPKRVLGKGLDGWPGERWLDIRRLDDLRPIMDERTRLCAEKGFDAIDFDNINGYRNDTGFPLKRKHQLAYDLMLADLAHEHGLAAGLKNVPELVDELEPSYDFVVNESCYQYDECEPYRAFIANDKPVFVVEYELPLAKFCPQANEEGFTAMRKRLNLKAWRKPCPP